MLTSLYKKNDSINTKKEEEIKKIDIQKEEEIQIIKKNDTPKFVNDIDKLREQIENETKNIIENDEENKNLEMFNKEKAKIEEIKEDFIKSDILNDPSIYEKNKSNFKIKKDKIKEISKLSLQQKQFLKADELVDFFISLSIEGQRNFIERLLIAQNGKLSVEDEVKLKSLGKNELLNILEKYSAKYINNLIFNENILKTFLTKYDTLSKVINKSFNMGFNMIGLDIKYSEIKTSDEILENIELLMTESLVNPNVNVQMSPYKKFLLNIIADNFQKIESVNIKKKTIQLNNSESQ